ncbi:hypothetical protein EUGRSUZ_B03423 [Eucalyptus grandis]|uniref:Uncharacterized protein n=2 Tax=Eucalyptus grandis TaxID=71139 RepID=A0A059D9D1_EUCGR|nr:hypothetical protein EUGRSUZ_B03423 [Eucalyptus grandis]
MQYNPSGKNCHKIQIPTALTITPHKFIMDVTYPAKTWCSLLKVFPPAHHKGKRNMTRARTQQGRQILLKFI